MMMIQEMFLLILISCYFASVIIAVKVEINPPGAFLLDLATKYLKIHDVVLVVFENTSIPVDEYADLFYNNHVSTSVYEWTAEENMNDQFHNFISVISKGRQSTITIFLDTESSEIFMQHAHRVRDHLFLPCYYRWVFFDLQGVNIDRLQYFNTSAVCWGMTYVKRMDGRESEDIRLSLLGPTLKRDGNCVVNERIGDWTSSKGLSNTKPFRKRIIDFKNRTFPAAFLNEHPFFVKNKEGSDFEGMEYDLLKTLKKKLNFRVIYLNNSDGEFGNQLPNGSWTGFVGLITSGQAIFSIGTLSISNRRMKAVDFSSPYLFGKLAFVILSPTLESRKFVLIKPLRVEVWAGLLGTFVICTLVLYLITHSLPCKSGVRRDYNIWFLLRTLGQQGTPSVAPARYSIRFFISGWWFFIMVILWSYAGTLTSFMTYPGRRPAIDTIKKLQNALISNNIRYGTLRGTTYESFLLTDMSNVNPIFGKTLIDNPESLVRTVPEGMRMVLQGKYAFVYMKAILKWFAATLGFDRFRFSKNVFSTEAVGIASQKCHPCKKSFDHIVDRLEETGFFSKWYNDAFTKASIQAPQVDIPGVRALSIDDVQGSFYFLFICLGVSFAVLVLEITISWITSCKRKAKRRKWK